MSRRRRVILYAGLAVLVVLLSLFFVARRIFSASVDCVFNSVSFDVKAAGLQQPGTELVVSMTPDLLGFPPTHLAITNGVSTKRVFFNPFSKRANCSGTLEAVEIVLEHNGTILNKVTLTYPKDFSRDEEGNYIAKEPVVLQFHR